MRSAPLLILVAISTTAFAQTVSSSAPEIKVGDAQRDFGAGLMPPVLPAGSTAAYGFIGAQEVGGGYRFGSSGFEIEGRGRFNYLLLSFGADAIGKYRLLERDRVEVGVGLGLGLGYDTGSRYFDRRNFKALLLRLEPDLKATYRVHDTLRAFAELNAPIDLGISPTGGSHVQILAGLGAEFFLGDDLSVFGAASMGPDVMREPGGVALWQIGYSVKLGVGYRMF